MADERTTAVRGQSGRAVLRPASAAMTPKEVLGVLRRHMLLIILLTIIGLAAGGGTCWLLRTKLPRFVASAYIEVLPPIQTDPMAFSPTLVQKDIRYGNRLSIANMIKQQGTLENLLSRQAVKDTQWFKQVNGLPQQVKYLTKYLNVVANRDADYIEVSMACRDAKEAADIVNEMVAMFIDSYGNRKQQEVASKLAELKTRQGRVQEDLRTAEKALEDVRTAWQLTDLEVPKTNYLKNTITMKLDQLELEKSDLEIAIKQLEADIGVYSDLAQGPISVQIQRIVETDPVMLALKQQVNFTEASLAGLLTKFGENHREVRQLQELKDEIQLRWDIRAGEIGEQTRQANLADAKDRLTIYKQRFTELERLRQEAIAKQKDLDMARIQYAQRAVIRDERIAMLDEIKKSIEKMTIVYEDPETPKVRHLSDAIKPIEQVMSRQWWLWFPGGTILGFLFSVGLAFLVEVANDLVRTPKDVGKYLNIPLLGVVPDASEDRDVRGIDLTRVVSLAPYSLVSEAYRQCRTNLKLSGSGKSLKTLLVTSGSAGDGKTCVAINLATAYVAEDKKVLLIDANFRQPTTEKLFPKGESGRLDNEGLSVGFGLSSLLVGQCGAQEAIRSSGIEGLDIIDAGLLPPNPAELLGSIRMAQLLSEQRNNYDFIIIDSPPVLLISDAKVLAKRVDATVVVFNASATRRGAAQRTIRELEEVDAVVVGCVLLAAPSLKGGYFQEQYKSYRRYQEKLQATGAGA
ncbi:MAG: polysaccharide biosynthesis tyrosine autokinase [Sedimentisphaerales bacterium]|nr:polysaccharide biosynthesis tyrosine autokinase [Sedimentisphaerales bacterium]